MQSVEKSSSFGRFDPVGDIAHSIGSVSNMILGIECNTFLGFHEMSNIGKKVVWLSGIL